MISFFRYWLPWVFAGGIIFFLSSKPMTEFPEVPFPFADKIVHIFLYAFFGFLFCRAITAKPYSSIWHIRNWVAVIVTALLALAYGMTDEYHQSFVPSRSVEGLDLLADTLGGGLGAIFALGYRHLLQVLSNKKNYGQIHNTR